MNGEYVQILRKQFNSVNGIFHKITDGVVEERT